MPGDLTDRFEAWVERIVRGGRFWIVVNESDQNTVLEDPEQDRDLQLIYASEADARDGAKRPADAGRGLRPDHIEVADLPALCTAAEERGDPFALWEDGNWIVAEPDLLREELEAGLGQSRD